MPCTTWNERTALLALLPVASSSTVFKLSRQFLLGSKSLLPLHFDRCSATDWPEEGGRGFIVGCSEKLEVSCTNFVDEGEVLLLLIT